MKKVIKNVTGKQTKQDPHSHSHTVHLFLFFPTSGKCLMFVLDHLIQLWAHRLKHFQIFLFCSFVYSVSPSCSQWNTGMTASICMKVKTPFRGCIQPFNSPTLFFPCLFSLEGFVPLWLVELQAETKHTNWCELCIFSIQNTALHRTRLWHFPISTSLWALLMTFTC